MTLNLTRRSVKGSPITAIEHDGNLDKLEAAIADPSGAAITAAVSAHVADPDPHPGYLTPAEGDDTYAPIDKGVTGGDAHDHSGGNGAQIAYSSLSGLPSVNTETLEARLDDFRDARTFYVSKRISASDNNNGTSDGEPFLTIGAAVAAANAFKDANPSEYVVVYIGPGVYVETSLPIKVRREICIKGNAILRTTKIKPAPGQEMNGFFKVDSGFMAWGLTFAGHQANSLLGQQSWAISFDETADNTAIGAIGLGAYIQASPYIQNCTSLAAEDDDGAAPSVTEGDTGGGFLVDGAACAINSPIRSMVVDSYTQVNLGGPGVLVKNDGYAQLVSFFALFCLYHVRTESGGQVNLSGGGTTDFGVYGLMADGYSPSALFTGVARTQAYGAARTEKAITINSSNNLFNSIAHGLAVNDEITLTATQGTLPSGLESNTIYYVISSGLTVDAFKLSATKGGSSLSITDTAIGSYQFTRQGELELDLIGLSANRLGLEIKYPTAGSLGSLGNPVLITARAGSGENSIFTVFLDTSTINHEYVGGGLLKVGNFSYPITSAIYNEATGETLLTAEAYAPVIGASVTLEKLSFICDSGSRPNAGQLMFPQLIFPRNSATELPEAKTFAYTRTGNYTLTYVEAASPNGPEHEYQGGGIVLIAGFNYGVSAATYNKNTGLVTLTTEFFLPSGNGNVTVNGLRFICPTSAYVVTSSVPIDSNGNPVANESPSKAGYKVLFFSNLNGGLLDPITQGQVIDFRNRSQISAPSHTFEFVGSGTNYKALPWNGGVPVPGNEIVETNNGRVYSSNTNEKGDFKVGTQFAVDGTTGSVTINTDQFNLSGLNFIGPFSRNGGFSTVGVQLREISNNANLIASTGAADGNTAPTQFAVKTYLDNNYAKAFNFGRLNPSTTWTINHNLGYYPSVELFSIGRQEIDGDVVHPSENQTVVTFTIATAGFARLN